MNKTATSLIVPMTSVMDTPPDGRPPCAPPVLHEYTLLRSIGRGSYGEVWIARNLLGSLLAAKIVYRNRFTDPRPYEREFEGIRQFEPISRNHPGLISILHVGHNDEAGYFYYIMELADNACPGECELLAYKPHTLRAHLDQHPRLSVQESLEISIRLAAALKFIHEQGLIHRDLKPSNIVFVNGVPRIADIGLVTAVTEDISNNGTAHYMPPEGFHDASGDIYSLGKVLYELFMGKHCKHFPDPPDLAEEFATVPTLRRINDIICRCCETNPRLRYQTGAELHEALVAVSEGRSASTTVTTEHTPAEADRRPLVCFIDDDAAEIKAFEEVFRWDLRTVTATRFAEAAAKLDAMGERPQLFVLDLYYPTGRDATPEERDTMVRLRTEVDAAERKLADYLGVIGQSRTGGLRLLQQVRAAFKQVPVVFYTRKGTLQDVSACLEAGALDVLRKPQPERFDPQRDTFSQIRDAAMAHRNTSLAKFEGYAASPNVFRKLFRAMKYVWTNWGNF